MLGHKRGARRITPALCLTPKDPCILDSSTAFIVDCVDHVIAYIYIKGIFFIYFPKYSAFQEHLMCMLRYKFREAAELRGGGGGGYMPPLHTKCSPK